MSECCYVGTQGELLLHNTALTFRVLHRSSDPKREETCCKCQQLWRGTAYGWCKAACCKVTGDGTLQILVARSLGVGHGEQCVKCEKIWYRSGVLWSWRKPETPVSVQALNIPCEISGTGPHNYVSSLEYTGEGRGGNCMVCGMVHS